MRTDPMGKFCHPEKRSVVGQCEGVCRSIAFVRDDALYGKSKTPSEETLTGFLVPRTGSIVVRIIPIVIRLLDRTPPTQDIFGIDRFLPDALVTCEKCQREQSKQCNKTQIKSSPPL